MQLFKQMVQEHDPHRLGAFLKKKGFTKHALANAKFNGGLLLVNHKQRHTNFILSTGDEVIFALGRRKENPWLKASENPVEIVMETDNYLIINKPAGVLSIPSRYEDHDAVVNRLLAYFSHQYGKEAAFLAPHVITRLDRNTSGLMLVGKNELAHARFAALDKAHLCKKYHAIVHGNFKNGEISGLIDEPIAQQASSVRHFVSTRGQRALTQYRVLSQVTGASLLEIRLLTGRTHQIRVHFSFLGHPLFGDHVYGAKDGCQRQALNAFQIAFSDPFTLQRRLVEIADPSDFKQLWQQLCVRQALFKNRY